ncbi:hypothetical protein KY285_013171 [Solanum tuberosum]|nr:hypothetical protein KY285_013171 [Solanum tuberosum]
MATGNETLPLEGKVTLKSIVEAITDMSWRIANMKERMASVEGRLGMKERVNIPSNGVPQSQPNTVVYPSLCKDSYVGTSVMKGGTRVPNQEPTTKGVTDAFVGCSSIQGKKDPSCGRQGTIATLDTFTIANEQSVNVSLSICEPIASLPCADNVLVKSVDTLVDPIDDQIDSSNNEITPSDVPSGVSHESSIVLDNYTCYYNPLWCETFPPKDGNLFLEDESTLVEEECDEECGICFPFTSSSGCVPIVNGMTHECESTSSHTHENTLEEVNLRDTFLYYLFTYDDAHAVEWSMLLGGRSAHLINGGALKPVLLTFYPFDPDGCLKAFELVGISSFGWCSLVVEKNDHCPCSPFVGLIAMTIEDIWLFLEFESPRLNVLSAKLCTTPHAERINSCL